MSLNTQQIKALKPKPDRKQYTVSDLGEAGLSLLVSANSKVFYYRYRTKDGRQKRIKIGKFDAVSLADARAKAKGYYLAVTNGRDPQAEIKSEVYRLKSRKIRTVQDLWNDYRQEFGLAKRSAEYEEYLWKNYVGATFSKYSVDEFDRLTIKAYIKTVRSEKSASLSNRIQSLLSRLGKHGFEELDLFIANPATGLGKKPQENSRDRNLNEDELKILWSALESMEILQTAKVSVSMARAIQLLILTLCRRSEIIALKWHEVDFDTRLITLPPERVKNKRTHLVPLSDQTLGILKVQGGNMNPENEYVFHSNRTGKHFYPGAVTKACRRLSSVIEVNSFGPHDLRRTGATILTSEKFCYPRFLVSRGLLNHASEKGGAAPVFVRYDKNDYIKEKREALSMWANYVVGLN